LCTVHRAGGDVFGKALRRRICRLLSFADQYRSVRTRVDVGKAVRRARCRYALGAPVTAAIAQIAEGDRQYHLVGLAIFADEIEAAGVTGQFAARDAVGVFGGWLTVLRMTEPHRWCVGRDRD